MKCRYIDLMPGLLLSYFSLLYHHNVHIHPPVSGFLVVLCCFDLSSALDDAQRPPALGLE